MCLRAPVEGFDFLMLALLRVKGIGKIGFWSVVNGMASMDLGSRCNEEWAWRLVKLKREHGVTGATPYSLRVS